MNNTKTTKRTLLSSVLAMFICVAMLIGTTFAWFTDSASTAVNKIQAGTLKVDIEMKDNSGNWVSAEGKTLQFKVDGQIPADGTQILWEPGCTYELPALRIVNKGNLALKYKVTITGIQGDAELNDAIEWTINGAPINLVEKHLAANTPDTAFVIKGHMQESAGNEYQGKSIDGIGITVVATQDTVEADSFEDQYDVSAEYPIAVAANIKVDADNKVAEEVTVESAQKVGTTNTPVAKVTVPSGAAVVNDTEQLELTIDEIATPANFVLEFDQTSKTLEIDMKGLDKVNNTELFKVEVFVGESRVDFDLKHNNTAMNKKTSLDAVSEDQDYYYNPTTGIVTFLTKTFSPFTAVYDKDSWSKHAAESYATPIDNKVVTIASAEELALFAKEVNGGKNYKGYTVNLTDNIDLGQYLWKPINNFAGTFDGNDKIVKNLTIIKANTWNIGFFSKCQGTAKIQNVTFENAYIVGGHCTSVVNGGSGGAEATMTNITVKGNVNITGGWYVGCILGKGYAKVSDCNVIVNEGSKMVCDGGYAGGIVGFMGEGNNSITDCNVENMYIESCWNGIGGISGILHYGNTITDCTVKNTIVHQNTDEAGETGRAAMIAGTYLTAENQTETLTNCRFIGGRVYDNTADYTGINWIGGPWNGYQPDVGTVVIENNIYSAN